MSWQPDYAHSHIQFSVRHLMISTVRGQFDKFKIDGDLNEQDVTKSKLEVQIEAASVNTKQEQRDTHLKSPDFFNAEKYPYLTFKSKRGVVIDEHHGQMIGDLTIRDVTKEVALDVEFVGQAKTPWGTTNAGFNARTKVNRKDWGLNYNVALETGGWMVGDDITIDIEVEFTKKPEPVATQPQKEPVAA